MMNQMYSKVILTLKIFFLSDKLTLASDANVGSDISFLIDTGSDRHIKFIDSTYEGLRNPINAAKKWLGR